MSSKKAVSGAKLKKAVFKKKKRKRRRRLPYRG